MQIFIACAPIPCAALYLGITADYTEESRWKVAVKANTIAIFIFFGAAFFGLKILEIFSISLDAFRIAGGIVMGMLGLNMLGLISKKSNEPSSKQAPMDIALTPVAFPIIAGPGSISAIVLCKSAAINAGQRFALYGAVVLIILTFFSLFYCVSFASKWLKPSLLKICSKLFGLIILTLGIQFIAVGLSRIVAS